MQLNHIYNGSCTDILDSDLIDEKSVQLIFADPPYNLSGNGLKWQGNTTGGDWYMVNEQWDKMGEKEYMDFTDSWIAGCKRVLKDNGSLFIACSYHNLGEAIMGMKQNGFKINNIITWYKTNSMPNMTKRVFTHATEFVVWGVKGSKWVFNYDIIKDINPQKQKDGNTKQMRDMWEMPLVQGKERIRGEDGKAAHPTQKPEEMLRRIILGCSNEGDIVLDPFCGSGTTCAVAKKYNRAYIGIEQEQKYVRVIKERLGIA